MICCVICGNVWHQKYLHVRLTVLQESTDAHLPRLGAACLGIPLAMLGSAEGSGHHSGAPGVEEAARVTDGDSRYKGASLPSLAGQGQAGVLSETRGSSSQS